MDKVAESRQNQQNCSKKKKGGENDPFVASRTRTNVHVATERASELPRLLMNNGAFFHTRRAIREGGVGVGKGGGEVLLLESSAPPPTLFLPSPSFSLSLIKLHSADSTSFIKLHVAESH